MSKPIVADIKPIKVAVEQDKQYYFCACGRSKKQPYCDGSHQGTGITPQVFKAKTTGDAYLCQCKQSANQPYCDGSHKPLTSQDIGTEVS